MKKIQCILLLFFVSIFLSSCDTYQEDLERQIYVNAIGIDYRDDNYVTYLQLINFQSTAKLEGQVSETKIWVGEGRGDTLGNALFDFYKTSQERVFWGHVTAVVISDAAFKHGMYDFIDSFTRYHEFRLTPWVFTTVHSIEDILSVGGFFGQSPLSTLLHEPQGVYHQNSNVEPIQLQKFIRQVYEPGFTSVIPSLVVNKKQWNVNGKKENKLAIDGALFMKNLDFQSYIPIEELTGFGLVQKGSQRVEVQVPKDQPPSIEVILTSPKLTYTLDNSSTDLRINVNLKATGYLNSIFNTEIPSLEDMTQKTKKVVQKQMQAVYQKGLQYNTDILNIEYNLYHNNYDTWKYLKETERPILNEDTLNNINVELKIINSSAERNSRVAPPPK